MRVTHQHDRTRCVLFLCSRAELGRERAGYDAALSRRGVRLLTLDEVPAAGEDLDAVRGLDELPALVVLPDPPQVRLPRGLVELPIPTAVFWIDTFVATRRRGRWSMLFDAVYVFHPGYDEVIRTAGHPGAVLFPHCIDPAEFRPALRKDIDVAMVGQTGGPKYRDRLRFVSALERHVRMSDWRRSTPPAEVPDLYGRARIVVNVGRDDYPTDVGIRFCEAMACGAVFLTRVPSELERLGFVDGRDFVGFRSPKELVERCRSVLGDVELERRIASSGRSRVLHEFSVDSRVATLLAQADGAELCAPARRWSRGRVASTYVDYLAASGQVHAAQRHVAEIGWAEPMHRLRASLRVARAATRRVVRSVTH